MFVVFTVLSASETASLAANTWSEKRFGFTSRHATPPREAKLIRRRLDDWVAGAARF